jgi:glutamyl-tRNA reductase
VSFTVVGLSHQTAAVEVRERIAFTAPGALGKALVFLRERLRPIGAEAVLLSTCNRTELYVASPAGRRMSSGDLRDLLVGARDVVADNASEDFTACLGERHGALPVTEHLFRVTSGLESMVLGENDIVRQVREAYAAANAARTTGPMLNPMFHEALRVAKRARTENDLGRGAFSVGHAAADLAETIFGSLAGRTVLLLGAGKMSETTARHLAASGASSVLVANRTFDRAARVAEILGGRAVPFEEFPQHLVRADIVIASTAAPHAIVQRSLVEETLRRRRNRPLFLIDIAVPRDIDPAVGTLDGVFLYDIDDLQQVVAEDIAERRARAVRAEQLVHEEAQAFAARLRVEQAAAPLITEVRAKLHGIVESEMERLRQRLPHLSEEDFAAISIAMQSVENKIAHDPTVKIKEFAAVNAAAGDRTPEHAAAKMETVRELFNLAASADAPGGGDRTP